MKYFTQVGSGKNAILIDPNGDSFEPYTLYKLKLIDNSLVSIGSLNDYLGHVARFIEYVYVASKIGLDPKEQSLDAIVRNYESYLLHGCGSSCKFVRDVANITGRTQSCSPTSLQVIEAALTHFLSFSDSLAKASGKDGLFSSYLPNLIVPISSRESAKLRCSSMLGAVIRGGARTKRKTAGLFLSTKKRGTNRRNSAQKRENFEFPLGQIGALIDNTSTYRDRAIYALLAASGLRTSEVLQLRVDDIDVDNKFVYAYSPFERANLGITEQEFDLLRWKGRQTSDTFLIEPWATYFFDSLRDYLRYEFIPGQGHPFVFQILSGPKVGRPYFSGDRSARIKQFRNRANAINVKLPKGDAMHSLRHSYGIYVLNYLPTPTGLGMSESIVANLMGHSDIKTTRIYAKHDKEIIRVELEFANRLIKNSEPMSKKQLLIKYYEQRISALSEND